MILWLKASRSQGRHTTLGSSCLGSRGQGKDTVEGAVAEAPVKTADTLAGVKAYLCLDKLNEVEGEALVSTQAHTFSQFYAESFTNILSDMDA